MYKNIRDARIYFIIHMLVEIVCFAALAQTYQLSLIQSAVIALLYDVIAFCPQFLFGLLHEKYKKLDLGSIGAAMMLLGLILLDYDKYGIKTMSGVFFIALGNAVIHECGAILTVIGSEGRLYPSALFVGGGSFGVVIGQTIGSMGISKWFLLIPIVAIEILILMTNKGWLYDNERYPVFDIINKRLPVGMIVIVAFLVTMTRSYLGYAIPISWKKELWQSFLLFFTMGIGKAFGGWAADRIGAHKTALITILASIPFLIAGENMMVVSIIGVFLFSMTMSITFGMLLSVMGENPGLAFGVTTMALAFGLLPVFFVKIGRAANIVIVIAGSLICAGLMYVALEKAKSRAAGDSAVKDKEQ